ncbi:MAG: SHOCT domain-containing protein, partial [Candidatus Bathyarchaeota archaeon]|nr:SHOCT domain-containing protein [Candidatus Bathyarchaeota archaeon]
EQLKKLKELLDMGAITQEEYNEKKKSLLEKV